MIALACRRWRVLVVVVMVAGCLPGVTPPAPEIAIEPPEPGPDDDLLLVLPDLGPDPAALGLAWQIGWSRDGETVPGLAGAEVVPAVETSPGEVWTATVALADDDEVGPAAAASVTIGDGGDDDSGDDDSGDDDDVTPPLLSGSAATGLCSAAGRATNSRYVAINCTGPLELAPGVSTNGIHTVVAGAVRLLPVPE